MKNFKLLMTFALCLAFGVSYGQIKVITSGYTGIGTATPAEQLDVLGNIQLTHTSGNNVKFLASTPSLVIEKRTASGAALVDISCLPLDGTSAANFRFFRTTNTTGLAKFDVHAANGTSAVNCRVAANTNSFFNALSGNVSIGQTAPGTEKLYVVGDVGATAFNVVSDKRLKTNVRSWDNGLDAVLAMRPVSYNYNGQMDLPTDRVHVGIIAQELQEVAPDLVEEFTYVKMDDEGEKVLFEEQYLKVHDSEIKYLLVNAIQEQNAQIKALEAQVAELAAAIKRNDTGSTQAVNISAATLAQNAPNPFNQSTVINYAVPTKAANATLQIFDLNGSVLKTVNLAKGNGQVTINAGELAAGTYSYNLVVDGNVVDTKKMVLTK